MNNVNGLVMIFPEKKTLPPAPEGLMPIRNEGRDHFSAGGDFDSICKPVVDFGLQNRFNNRNPFQIFPLRKARPPMQPPITNCNRITPDTGSI
jgi:hypothetical protein